MGERDILVEVASLFSKHKIPYLLTGSFAVSYYGIPRATHDIDFIVEVSTGSAYKIQGYLQSWEKATIFL